MTTIIAFANQKGGVAKTTSVVSLGGALVACGEDVFYSSIWMLKPT